MANNTTFETIKIDDFIHEPINQERVQSYPPELVGRFNSFIVTAFDDSMTVEMQLRTLIKWIKENIDVTTSALDNMEAFKQDSMAFQNHVKNTLVNLINQFIDKFDDNLKDETLEILNQWLVDGVLSDLVRNAINEEVINARGGKTTLGQRLDETDAQLTQTTQENTKNNDSHFLSKMLKYPDGMPHLPINFKVMKDTMGKFKVIDFNLESLHPKTPEKAYYVATDGDDVNNDGLTPDTPFRTLNKAFVRDDVDVVYMLGGDYGTKTGFNLYLPDRDIKVKAYKNQKVKYGCFHDTAPSNWVQHSPGTYKYNRANTLDVYDTKVLNDYGNYTRYTKETSISGVESNAGSWFLDSDNMLYVHTIDNRQPSSKNADIKVVLTGFTIMANKLRSYYFEGITFEFGISAFSTDGVKQALFKDCQFNYATTRNGLTANDTDLVICQNCVSYGNFADSFNYHANNWSTKYAYFLEIDCVGFGNGYTGAVESNNNGSTGHVNCVGVRINGLYFDNWGPNVVDVGTRNYSWNIGCTAYNSTFTGDGFTGIDFMTENLMWLESCVGYGSELSTYANEGQGKFYVRNCYFKEMIAGDVQIGY